MAKMNKQPKKQKSFKLTVHDGMIAFLGGTDVFRTARKIDGVEIRSSRQFGEFLCVPMTRENFMITESLASPETTSDTYLKARARFMAADLKQLGRWMRLGLDLKRPMMAHQDNFCAQAFDLRGILNGSEQGTGKTQMAIALYSAWEPRRGLVVCPKSLMYQWESEFSVVLNSPPAVIPLGGGMTVADKKDIVRAMGQDEMLDRYDRTVLVINYEILAEMKNAIMAYWNPDYLVFDEAWKVKAPTALTTRAAIEIADNVPHDGHIQLLSGTPVGNHVGDLWSQMNIIKSDPYIEDYDEWMAQYALFRPIEGPRGRLINIPVGCKDPAALMKRIAPQYFRATKASCLSLPDKAFDTIKFDMPKLVERLYRRVEEMGNEVFDPLSLSGERVTKLRLQQITGGCVPEIKDIQTGLAGATIIESPKREFVKDFARDVLKSNPEQRLIVWCKFNAEIAELKLALGEILGRDAVVAVTRHTTDAELADAKANFNLRTYGVAQVLVAQIKKLAYGHNLQSGDWNICYSHPWSFIDRSQLEDRTHRMGRDGVVHYIDLVMRGYYIKGKDGEQYVPSIDEEVLDTIKRKGNLAARLGPDTVGNVHE